MGVFLRIGAWFIALMSVAVGLSGAQPPGPTITPTSALSQVLAPGGRAEFSSMVSGSGPLLLQWFHNGRPVEGATGTALIRNAVALDDEGWYALRATDTLGVSWSAGYFLTVAPTRTQIRAWGDPGYQQLVLPEIDDAIEVVAGQAFAAALRRDGTVRVWGNSAGGVLSPPTGLNNVVQIAAGAYHMVALRADGRVVTWGTGSSFVYPIPDGLEKVVAIAAGESFSLALKSDGTVVAWGENNRGQATVPAWVSDIIAIGADKETAFAITRDNSVVGWGYSGSGEMEIPAGLKARQVAGRSSALKLDGSVVVWGRGYPDLIPYQPEATDFWRLAPSGGAGIRRNGTVMQWSRSGPAEVPGDIAQAFRIASRGSVTFVLRDATADTAPVVVSQPADQIRIEEEALELTIGLTGAGPFSYQWRKNGTPIPDANSAVFAIASLVPEDAGSYDVVVRNHIGTVMSAAATVVIRPLPIVTNAGTARRVAAPGETVQFNATAIGTGTLSLQWLHNGRPMAGAIGASLSLAEVSFAATGWYALRVTDSVGSRSGEPFFLNVAPVRTEVVFWGDAGSEASKTVPSGLQDAVSVHIDPTFSTFGAAVRRNGTVTIWGSNYYGASTLPEGLQDVVTLSIGRYRTLALKADGTVRGWGTFFHDEEAVLPGLRKVAAIAAGGVHGVALTTDRKVITWGHNGTAVVPEGLAEVVSIAAGSAHLLAAKLDGTVVAWGGNSAGQCNVPVGLSGVVAVYAAGDVSLARKADGTVVAWGSTSYYQTPVPAGIGTMTDIAGSIYHVAGLRTDGTVAIWGWNVGGIMNVPVQANRVFQLAAGKQITYALRDPTLDTVPVIVSPPQSAVRAEGDNVNFSVTVTGVIPLSYQWRKDFIAIAGATGPSLALTELQMSDAGAYDVVITNALGSTPSAAATLTINPLPSVSPVGGTRRVLAPGAALSLGVTASGNGSLSYRWKHNGRVLAGETAATLSRAAATRAEAGWYIVEVTDSNGTRRSAPFFVQVVPALTQVRMWGRAASITSLQIPTTPTNYAKVAAGQDHQLILKHDGTIEGRGAWAKPASVTGSFVDVAAETNYSVVLRDDGRVFAWNHKYGSISLLAVLSRNDFVAIAAGSGVGAALRSNGNVIWWTEANGVQPTPEGVDNIVAIACGPYGQVLALRDNGTVVAWGFNGHGQANVPAGLTDVAAVSAGGKFSLALKTDGSIITWGDPASVANIPANAEPAIAISAGLNHALALRADGTVVAWGDDYWKQSAVPTGATEVFEIWATTVSSYLVRDATGDSAPIISTPPQSQSVAEMDPATFSVGVSGGGPFTFQWRKDGVPLAGETSAQFRLAEVSLENAGSYTVAVVNARGTTVSPAAVLTVRPVPVVTSLSPRRHVIDRGGNLTLSVEATGTGTLTYQWVFNGADVPGATQPTFAVTDNFTVDHAGWYAVKITDTNGTRLSPAMFALYSRPVTRVRVWGANQGGVSAVPAGLNDVVSLAVAPNLVLALRRDGSVTAWGAESAAKTQIPPDLTEVVALRLHGDSGLALKSNGTVVVWGSAGNVPPIPANLKDVVALGAFDVPYAIRSNGAIVPLGVPTWLPPAPAERIVSLTAGDARVGAVRNDGTLIEWGLDVPGPMSAPVDLGPIRSIGVGNSFSFALRPDGTLRSWARPNAYFYYSEPNVPAGLGEVRSISVNGNHIVALKRDGSVVTWGNNSWGQNNAPVDLAPVIAAWSGQTMTAVIEDSTPPLEPPVITDQPSDQHTVAFRPITLTAVASGGVPLVYRWEKDGVELSDGDRVSGAHTATLNIGNVQAGDAGGYVLRVRNADGAVATRTAQVTVAVPPVVTSRPASRAVGVGDPLEFSVTATDPGTVTYRWYFNGRLIPGANGPTYAIPAASPLDRGHYRVTMDNGTAQSHAVFTLQVFGTQPSSRRVVAWGGGFMQPVELGGGDRIIELAAGGGLFGLRDDGVAGAWENNTFQPQVTGISSVAAGSLARVMLRSDGTALVALLTEERPIAPLYEVVQVAVAGNHAVALTADGRVWQVNAATGSAFSVVPGLTNVVRISAQSHIMALGDGGVVSVVSLDGTALPVPPDLGVVRDIASGTGVYVALLTDGTARAWGPNATAAVEALAGLRDVASVATADNHGLVLQENGQLRNWGRIYNTDNILPDGLSGSVAAITAGYGFAAALVNFSAPVVAQHPRSVALQAGGEAVLSSAANGAVTHSHWEYRLPGSATWVPAVNVGVLRTRVDTDDLWVVAPPVGYSETQVRCVFANSLGTAYSNPATLTIREQSAAVQVSGGARHALFVRNDGTLWGMGRSAEGQLGITSARVDSPVQISTGVARVAAGGAHTWLLKLDGTLWGSGSNEFGAVGNNSSQDVITPVAVATNVSSMAAGKRHGFFIQKDGSLWAVGANASGQLGDGSTVSQSAALRVGERVVRVAAGGAHSLIIKGDGSLWATGANSDGQLGDGSTASRTTFGPVGAGFAEVAAGDRHSLLLRRDGRLQATGANTYGQLGDGSQTSRANAVTIADGVVAIAAGADHSVFLKQDGTAWTMGRNDAGQLGDGTYVDRSLPVPVGVDVVAIAAGARSTYLIRRTGTLQVCGDNASGQLGWTGGVSVERPITIVAGGFTRPGEPLASGSLSAEWDHVELHWSPVAGAVHYELRRATTPVFSTARIIAPAEFAHHYDDFGGTQGKDMYYFVRAVNPAGPSTADHATMGRFGVEAGPVVFTLQPQSQTVLAGSAVTFTAAVSNAGNLAYQWTARRQEIPGATSPTLTIPNVQLEDAGYYALRVTSGTGTYQSARAMLYVNKRSQTIAFPAPAARAWNSPPVDPGVAATSGLPVTLSILSGPAEIDNGRIRVSGVGTVLVSAKQDGNEIYEPASTVVRSIVVTKAAAQMHLGDLIHVYDGTAHAASFTTTPAGLAAQLTYDNQPSPPSEGGTYEVAGLISDPLYEGGARASLEITKAAQSIAYADVASRPFSAGSFAPSFHASSGLPLAVGVAGGPGRADGTYVVPTGVGTVVVRAEQKGNRNYGAAALDVPVLFTSEQESWREFYFTVDELALPAVSGAMADPDGDGLGNLLEYALGTDPRVGIEPAGVRPEISADNGLHFTFRRPAELPDTLVQVESSSDLQGWEVRSAQRVEQNEGWELWRVTLPGDSRGTFFRLRVEKR